MQAGAIETTGLGKRFGDRWVVRGLDWTVPAGSFYAFLGPNGAGKSTTLGLCTGLIPPDEGTVRIRGETLGEASYEARRLLGVVPEELALFERMGGEEQLVFAGRLHGFDASTARDRARELLTLVELDTPAARNLVADYSKGMRRRLALATALVHGPRVLVLDEPFEGIDIRTGAVIRALLRHLCDAGVTIILTTHVFEIAERLATHVGMLVDGRLIVDAPVESALRDEGVATLEELFVRRAGAPRASAVELSWYRPPHGRAG